MYRSTRELCEPRLSATSIYRLLGEQGHRLFADEAFADLFEDVGRRSVPPRIVATVMVLQRIEGVSDREAVDRFAFDERWKYAIEANTKVQPPSAREGKFSQDDFRIDLDVSTVQCPADQLVTLRLSKDGSGEAVIGALCNDCLRRAGCTESQSGRTIRVHRKHRTLDGARERQRDANWKERYGSRRPKVERKIAHLMRRKHGGRRARMRGQLRIADDFALLAAAINLARLAGLGVRLTDALRV